MFTYVKAGQVIPSPLQFLRNVLIILLQAGNRYTFTLTYS